MTTTTTPTLDQLLAVGGSLWERDTMRRVYFNDLRALAELDVTTYGTGNVSSARWQGEALSNTRANEILFQLSNGKIWYDLVSAQFYSRIPDQRTVSGRDLGTLIVRNIRARIAALSASTEG